MCVAEANTLVRTFFHRYRFAAFFLMSHTHIHTQYLVQVKTRTETTWNTFLISLLSITPTLVFKKIQKELPCYT